jgi:hypothetical protein
LVETTKTITDGAPHARLSLDQQHERHRRRGGGVSLHDERVSAMRELADTVAERSGALRSSPDVRPGAVAQSSEEPAAHGALAGPDVVQLPTRCPIGAVRALMQLGMVRVEGAS